MNLIYSHNYASAHSFALLQDLAAGDWKWINDARVVKDYPRADVYKVSRWEGNPRRGEIDAALEQARKAHRLGTLTDYSRPYATSSQ